MNVSASAMPWPAPEEYANLAANTSLDGTLGQKCLLALPRADTAEGEQLGLALPGHRHCSHAKRFVVSRASPSTSAMCVKGECQCGAELWESSTWGYAD